MTVGTMADCTAPTTARTHTHLISHRIGRFALEMSISFGRQCKVVRFLPASQVVVRMVQAWPWVYH